MNQLNLDELPNELLNQIFLHLDFEILVQFRTVCKRWMSIIDKLIKLRPIVLNEENDPFNLKLFYNNEILNYRNCLIVNSSNYFNQLDLLEVWKKIKKLIIFNCDLDFNLFEELEHCETHCSKVMELRKMPDLFVINLNKIKILNLLLGLSVRTYFVFNTPELHHLKIPNIEFCQFKYPEKLETLECNVFSDCIYKFSNLINLICDEVHIYDGKLLSNLIKLKEFQVNCIDKLDLNHLLKERNDLNLNNLNIIVKGIKIDEIKKEGYPAVLLNNDFKIFSSTNRQLFLDNYDNLHNNLHFINDFFIDFDLGILPKCMFNKINNLETIVVHHEIESEMHWILLLKSSKIIKTIKIFNLIDQYFYDLISVYQPLLSTLFIQKSNIDNLNFVCKLKNLERFTTDQELKIDELKMLINLVNTNKYLKQLTFKFRKIDFKIEIIDYDVYCEYYKHILIVKLDELIKLIDSSDDLLDIIKRMKHIGLFNRDAFKGKLFRLCYQFKSLGCDVNLEKKLANDLIF